MTDQPKTRLILTPEQRYDYDQQRAKGHLAKAALIYAKRNEGGPDVPHEDGETFERDGFTLTVRVFPDYDIDYEEMVYGSWKHSESAGTVDRAKAGYFVGDYEVGYFLPNITEDEHIEGGATKAEARRYVLEDLDRAERYEKNEWHALAIRLTATKADVELGSASISGIASDEGDSYIRWNVNELADEAIDQAKEAVERLCGCPS